MIRLSNDRVSLTYEPAVGHMPSLAIDGTQVLHAAPWRAAADIQADRSIPMVDRRLGGTFFCAPFGQDDVDYGPPHGAPANTRWIVKRHGPTALRSRLAQNVKGARLDHDLVLRDADPVVYQTHYLRGGRGPMTMAHHPMLQLPGGGRFRCSPKRLVFTETQELEPGAGYWDRAARADGWQMPRRDHTVDLRDYPDAPCEDFLTMVEAEGTKVGWTAVERFAQDDTIIILRDARVMPVTMIWVSNGGRKDAPWNGTHTGVLGIEDGCTGGGAGYRAAHDADGPVAQAGVPTALELGQRPIILRHAIARIGARVRVSDIEFLNTVLRAHSEDGAHHDIPFDTEFFA